MIPENVRTLLFAVLDQAERADLSDRALVRECLHRVAVGEGEPLTDALEEYIGMLVDEFCPVRHTARRP